MAYIPILLGVLTACCWGTADFLSRRQSEKVGHYNTAVYLHITAFVFTLMLLPFLDRSISLPPQAAAVLVAAGALNFFAFIFLYRAFHRGVVSVVAPIAYAYPAVTAVLSVVIFGTVVTAWGGVAMAGIMVGVVLLSTRFSELRWRGLGRQASLTPGVGAAVLSALAFGTVYIGVGYATPLVGFVLPVLFLRGVGSVIGLTLAPVLKQPVSPYGSGFSRIILVMGILETAGFLAFNYGISLSLDSLPMVAALSGMGGAFATGYAMVLLKERLELNQIAGALLSVVGVFALLYLSA